MDSTPSASKPGIANRRSGKVVLILALVVFPLILVPALLTGRIHEDQICLHTLQQRSADYWIIGSWPIGEITWKVKDEWPQELQTDPLLFSSFQEWPEATPSEYYLQMKHGTPASNQKLDHLWESTSRELALAFVLPVPNTRALLSTAKPVVAARALMTKALTEGDGDEWNRLNTMITEEAPENKVPRHGRLKSETDWDYAGQKNAASILSEVQSAWSDSDSELNVAQLRQILLQIAE